MCFLRTLQGAFVVFAARVTRRRLVKVAPWVPTVERLCHVVPDARIVFHAIFFCHLFFVGEAVLLPKPADHESAAGVDLPTLNATVLVASTAALIVCTTEAQTVTIALGVTTH